MSKSGKFWLKGKFTQNGRGVKSQYFDVLNRSVTFGVNIKSYKYEQSHFYAVNNYLVNFRNVTYSAQFIVMMVSLDSKLEMSSKELTYVVYERYLPLTVMMLSPDSKPVMSSRD